MKTLQNNFTTPEQSKRLLELGVPADSADCYYSRMRHEEFENPRICYMQYFNHTCFHPKIFIYLPCWSVGRLMEIIRICNLTAEKPWVYIEQDNISAMITAIIDGVNNCMLDFSKLEE